MLLSSPSLGVGQDSIVYPPPSSFSILSSDVCWLLVFFWVRELVFFFYFIVGIQLYLFLVRLLVSFIRSVGATVPAPPAYLSIAS